VGEIAAVDVRPLRDALDRGYVPVVATIAPGSGEDEGRFLNVNADSAAAAIAVALGAEKLVLLTDVPGLLRDVKDEGTLVSELPRAEIPALVASGVVSRGMIPKVDCCARAVDGGVQRAHILDGRAPHSLLLELFSDRGVGTMIL
jgi:acetylglutamate kinase